MITGLPLQTMSTIQSLRGWGCYAHVLAAMVADAQNHVFTRDDIANIFRIAVSRGIIIDNAKPFDGSAGPWYRAFIGGPRGDEKELYIALVASYIGVKVAPKELYRGPDDKIARGNPKVKYLVLEWYASPATAKTRTSHFTVECSPSDTKPYDPWPKLPRYELRTIRGWTL